MFSLLRVLLLLFDPAFEGHAPCICDVFWVILMKLSGDKDVLKGCASSSEHRFRNAPGTCTAGVVRRLFVSHVENATTCETTTSDGDLERVCSYHMRNYIFRWTRRVRGYLDDEERATTCETTTSDGHLERGLQLPLAKLVLQTDKFIAWDSYRM